ncbi:MAG: NPCBM/NEW2 domain-containing protein [Clostridium sp.]
MKKAISTLAIAAILSGSVITPAFAETVQSLKGVNLLSTQEAVSDIKSQVFDLYSHENYLDYSTKFEVKPISYVNNGGQYASSSLNKAFDNILSTHWETGKPNSSVFKNTVTVAFDKIESINRLVYAVRQDNGYKGYPREMKIYSSLTDSGEDFKLVAQGNSSTEKSLIEFKFNSSDFKRLRIEFVDPHDGWASAAELKFFKQDKVVDEIDSMFTDRTYSSLKSQFNSLDKITQMEQELVNHPIKDKYLKRLEIAKKIIRNEMDADGRIIKPRRVGDIKSHSGNNLKFGLGMNFQSTGIYALPGDVVTLYVEAGDSGPMPQVSFSQNEGTWKGWQKTIGLKPGINEFVVPDFPYGSNYPTNPKKGGAIYIVNQYDELQQPVAPVIRIEGGNKFPLFNEGEDPLAFRQELIDYKVKLDQDNAAGTNKVLDIAELNSDRMMLACTTTGAYEAYVTKNLDPNNAAKFWDDTLEKLFGIYNLDRSKLIHDPKFTKEQIRFMQPYGAMYAAGDHVGVQKNVMVLIHDPEGIKKSSWGFIHELGHRMDMGSRTWGEVTNNMVSLIMSYHYGNPNDRVKYETGVYPQVAPDIRTKTFDEVGLFDRLGMFWQLQVYDNNYWGKINALYREKYPAIANEQQKRDIFIEYSSEVMNLNLGEYFKRHGFEASRETLDKISKYPVPSKKLWYLRGAALQYTGTGFTANVKPEINSIVGNATNRTNTLSFNINTEDDKNILGYEVYRDGKVIGFTGGNSFVDSNVDININNKYEVIAYDMKLNASPKVEYNSQQPVLKADSSIILEKNQSFNPLSYVTGLTHTGENITGSVIVKSNTVNTAIPGSYQVIYELTNAGLTSTKIVEVQVAAGHEYITNLPYTKVVSGWGGIQNDKSPSLKPISLLVNGVEKTFTKGLGAHANSEIKYDLTGNSYDYFTVRVGIDGAMRSGTRASAKYKIVLDGTVVYESKQFTCKDDSELIKIPLNRAKEIRLITDMANGNDAQDHTVWADAKFVTLK